MSVVREIVCECSYYPFPHLLTDCGEGFDPTEGED